MKLDDLINLYEDKKRLYGNEAYLHISEIFEEAREEYKQEYLASSKAAKLRAKGKVPDAEQSWKAFKGKNFERVEQMSLAGSCDLSAFDTPQVISHGRSFPTWSRE